MLINLAPESIVAGVKNLYFADADIAKMKMGSR